MPATSGLWDKIAGNTKEFGGNVKKQWGKLTDDEIMQVNGNRDVLAGKIQEKYGVAKEEAHKQIDAWAHGLDKATK